MTPPCPIILDCDPGTDDAVAILLALGSPELDVRAVTVVGGNVGLEHTLRNALALVAATGRPVPVYAGADRSLLQPFTFETRVHGNDGIGGVALPAGGAPAPGIAADAIRAILRDSAEPVTLVGIGPATNLGIALASEPALAERVAEVVLMTGAWGEGNVTPSAEFNAYNDPEALAILLGCGRPVTLVTLDLTAQALVTPARIGQLSASAGGRCLDLACRILATVPPSKRSGELGSHLHDPCAIAWLVLPALFTGREAAASVDLGPGPCRGRTVIDRWNRLPGPRNARVLEALDADGFFALLGERIGRLP